MKAIRLHARGGPESLRFEDAPTPRPGAGEVLVRVRAAAVTPTELLWVPTWATRDGGPRPLPVIPGHEFSGEVAALGEGVTAVGGGEAVYGMNDWFGDGAQAEYCLARPADVARKPASVDHAHAAVTSLPPGLSTLQDLSNVSPPTVSKTTSTSRTTSSNRSAR